MVLLLDVGNSAVKWACSTEGRLQPSASFLYTRKNLDLSLNHHISDEKHGKPSAVFISNVAGDLVKRQLIYWCESRYQLTPFFPYPIQQAYGLFNAYQPFDSLGVDRWLALIAANQIYNGPICVVDCGTAATIDVIDGEGRFVGGVILPGLRTMQQSLQRNTDAIERVFDLGIENTFALSTEQCVLAGATLAITASIEKMTRKLDDLTEQKSTCVLTGGDADKLIPYLSIPVEQVNDLVMQGLYLWGKKNGLGV